MSINFLLQSLQILYNKTCTDDELRMMFDILTKLDNFELNKYNNTCSIVSYSSDLELYIEVLDLLIKQFENKEEYEKCAVLKINKQKSLDIIYSKV